MSFNPSKRTSPPPSHPEPPVKKVRAPVPHNITAAPPTAVAHNAMSDIEEEVRPRRDKGKAKQRVLPELPDTVWMRIFELHYEDIAEGELDCGRPVCQKDHV